MVNIPFTDISGAQPHVDGAGHIASGADKVLGVDMLVFMTALIWILLSRRWPGATLAANAGRASPV